jgi:hypothetical protein
LAFGISGLQILEHYFNPDFTILYDPNKSKANSRSLKVITPFELQIYFIGLSPCTVFPIKMFSFELTQLVSALFSLQAQKQDPVL